MISVRSSDSLVHAARGKRDREASSLMLREGRDLGDAPSGHLYQPLVQRLVATGSKRTLHNSLYP